MDLLMFLSSLLSHEKFVSLLPILLHHPFGTTRSHSIPGSFFGSVWAAISSPINLSPGNLFSFIFVAMPIHHFICLSGQDLLVPHPTEKGKNQFSMVAIWTPK